MSNGPDGRDLGNQNFGWWTCMAQVSKALKEKLKPEAHEDASRILQDLSRERVNEENKAAPKPPTLNRS